MSGVRFVLSGHAEKEAGVLTDNLRQGIIIKQKTDNTTATSGSPKIGERNPLTGASCQGVSTAARSYGARLPLVSLCVSVNEPLEDVIGYYTSQHRQQKTNCKLQQADSPPFWLPSLGRGNDTIIPYSVDNGRKMSGGACF